MYFQVLFFLFVDVNGRVQRLVSIRFRQRDVVVKFARHRFPETMHLAEHIVASLSIIFIALRTAHSPVILRLYWLQHDPQGQLVVNLVEVESFAFHFAVNGINVLGASRHHGRDIGIVQANL